jgi:hypothetical protein
VYESLEKLIIVIHPDRLKCRWKWPTTISNVTLHECSDTERAAKVKDNVVGGLRLQKEEHQKEDWKIPDVEVCHVKRGHSFCCKYEEEG